MHNKPIKVGIIPHLSVNMTNFPKILAGTALAHMCEVLPVIFVQ